jgi:hypothetical protein
MQRQEKVAPHVLLRARAMGVMRMKGGRRFAEAPSGVSRDTLVLPAQSADSD